MNKLKKHIVGFFFITLSLVILMTTSGFSIYVHHCNKSQTDTYSLFVPSDGCEKHQPNTVEKSCCAVKADNSCANCQKQESGQSCCTNHKQVLKLYTPTVLNHTVPVLKIHEIEWFPTLYSIGVESLTSLIQKESIHYLDKLPPPFSVHDFLARIQVYLI
ncbi:MAG: hypothetical protein WCX31_18590 [Salinivirgaceae bacterium]|jgi:hypothetical protein